MLVYWQCQVLYRLGLLMPVWGMEKKELALQSQTVALLSQALRSQCPLTVTMIVPIQYPLGLLHCSWTPHLWLHLQAEETCFIHPHLWLNYLELLQVSPLYSRSLIWTVWWHAPTPWWHTLFIERYFNIIMLSFVCRIKTIWCFRFWASS
jgi:hypothetical protein